MSFIFNKLLNSFNYASDSFAVSNLYPNATDKLRFAHEQVTSLGAADSTTRIYSKEYTISTSALSVQTDVSGAGTYGFFGPSYTGNADNSVLLIGYSAGGTLTPYIGFVIKEEASGSLGTWANTWSGGGAYDNDAFRGLFRDQSTGDVFAVTQSARLGGYKINVHKRTGAGTWTSHTAFTGTNTNFYDLQAWPQQQCLFVNGKALIVGSKQSGSVVALTSTDLTTWVEKTVVSYGDGASRYCKVARGTDNLVRLMIPNFDTSIMPTPPTICFSADMGLTWTTIGVPPGLKMEDGNGQEVGWPDVEGTSFIMDGRGRMYLIVADILNPRIQLFRAWSTKNTSWGLVETDTIVDGSSNTYTPAESTTLPSSAIVVGTDIFRVVCSWLAAGYVQAWMIKDAGGAVAAGGRTGGGKTPRKYTEE